METSGLVSVSNETVPGAVEGGAMFNAASVFRYLPGEFAPLRQRVKKNPHPSKST